MQIVSFKSLPRATPFAPEYHYVLGEDSIDGVDFDRIAKLVLSKEPEVIAATLEEYKKENQELEKLGMVKPYFDGYTGLGENSLTSRSNLFNVFCWEDEEIQKLKGKLHEKYLKFLDMLNVPRSRVWLQCWANVLRDGEEIKPHIHSVNPFCYLGGHIVVQCNDTSTVYINPVNQINDPNEHRIKNVVGAVTIFQECVPHYTTPHSGDKERITLAFDLLVDEQARAVNAAKPFTSNLILFDDV
jgi:hypothetical protein